MKPLLRFLIVSLAVATASLVPQAPTQASELVKLGRLLVTGKRTPAATSPTAPVADEAKPAAPAVNRPVADAEPARAVAVRAGEAAGPESREARETLSTPTERPAQEGKGLERGGVNGGAAPSSERGSLDWGWSLKGLLRGL